MRIPSPTFRHAPVTIPGIQRSSSKRQYFSLVETEEIEDFWIQWVRDSFPDLHRNIFLLPPVSDIGESHDQQSSAHYKESKQTTSATSQHRIPRPTHVEYNDIRADAVLQRVLICLKKMLSKSKKKMMFGLSQLRFGRHLSEPCYTAATNFLPSSTSFPPVLPRNWKQGDFDLLIIHPSYGLVVFEVKAFGDNLSKHDMSQQDQKKIRSKLNEAMLQLERAKFVLSRLVSDIAPGLRITKTIVVPDLTAVQVQQALTGDRQLIEDMCQCLGANDLDEITGLCLCSDQLSDPETPWIVSSEVLRKLSLWWQRLVTDCAPNKEMTFEEYLRLIARLCGPAMTVTVPCIAPPRLRLQTSSQPSSSTGQCYYAQITLFPEQVYLLNSAPPRLFLAGPPGTGKTVVLQLKAEEWLRCGNPVFMVSTWSGSRAACYMTYHLLQQTRDTQQESTESSGQLHLLQYDLNKEKDIENAVDDLTLAAREGSLYVIADEMGPPGLRTDYLKAFCDKLLTQVPHLHFWAASYYYELAPSNWQLEYLNRPIRSPPSTYDPPIQRMIYHWYEGHTTLLIEDCVKCGQEAATFLHRLCAPGNTRIASSAVTSTKGKTESLQLQYRDMLILSSHEVADETGMVKALRDAGIPVRVMEDEDIEDVATARSDVVWVANEDIVRGLERKVIIVIENTKSQFHVVSRCTEQLIVITNQTPPLYAVQSTEEKTKTTANKKYDEVSDKVSNEENQQENLKELEKRERDKPESLAKSTAKARVADFKNTRTVFEDILIKGISTAEEKNADKKSDQNSDEDCCMESDKNVDVEERQEKERRKHEASAICTKKGADDTEIQKNTGLGAGLECYSFPFKIKLDLGEAAAVTPPQPIMEPSCSRDDYGTEEASGTCDDTFSSPVFSDHWQDRVCFSAEGGRLQKQGSDVVLQVSAGAIEINTNVTVHVAISANDWYIKHKLQLPSTETIVSPLAEFWAGPDFHFQKHVEITLPTCLPSDYDVNLLHVYCILSENPEGQVDITKVQALKAFTHASDIQKPYFQVTGNRQVQIMTSHFSGYLCTYCGICLDIGLEVYATHKHYKDTVNVSIMAQFWDKLNVQDYKQLKPELDSYRIVLRETLQLEEVLKPGELQVDLIIDDEQKAMWQFKERLAPTNKFRLNSENIRCENSEEHMAAKYTNLGPFSFGWRLKEKPDDNEETPSTLDFYILVSHLKQGSTVPLWSTVQYEMNVQRPSEDNGAHSNMNITIQNVENLHIAQVQETQQGFA